MSKSDMPGSMDLLLDTMCNTFGGVVFIALSLSLAFFVSHSQSSQEADPEKISQELKAQQQEHQTLKAKRDDLMKRLASMRKAIPQNRPVQPKTDLSEQVTSLEQDCKDIQRETEIRKMSLADLERKIRDLERENKKLVSDNLEKTRKVVEKVKKMEEEYKRLCFIFDELNKKLQSIPAKKLHFAHNERTSSSPYVLVIKNNRLHRLGKNYLNSSQEVRVRRSGNMLILTCAEGTPLQTITNSDLQSLFRDFSKRSTFLYIALHPDSFESFVNFRRALRDAGFPVDWHINNELVLHLTDKADYSASY